MYIVCVYIVCVCIVCVYSVYCYRLKLGHRLKLRKYLMLYLIVKGRVLFECCTIGLVTRYDVIIN